MSCAFAFVLAFPAPVAHAHPVSVDGDPADWFALTPPADDVGRVARDGSGRGEFVWRDAGGDALTELAGPGRDLQSLRVTGSPAGLFVIAQLSPGAPTSGAGAPQLQLAFDLDHFFGLGGATFGQGADLYLAPQAAWEALVVTRFGSARNPIAWTSAGPVTDGPEAVLTPAGTIEMFLPWKAVGLYDPPVGALRMSAALFVSTADDSTLEVGDESISDAADVMTQYSQPGVTANTPTETADLSLDYWVDLWVDPRGEVRSPLTISEFDMGPGPHVSWIELVNVTSGPVSLANWKFGNAAVPRGAGAMGRFTGARLLAPNDLALIAADGAQFHGRFGINADVECSSYDATTPDLVAFTPWAATAALDVATAGDALLLLDPSNTVQDVVAYKGGSYPGVGSHGSVATGHSLERARLHGDTDDCATDFADNPNPTPGSLPPLLEAPPLAEPGRLLLRGAWPQPSADEVFLDLAQPVRGPLTVAVYDIGGRFVTSLPDGKPDASEHVFRWDGRDAAGRRVPAGVYLARVRGAAGVLTVRLVRVD